MTNPTLEQIAADILNQLGDCIKGFYITAKDEVRTVHVHANRGGHMLAIDQTEGEARKIWINGKAASEATFKRRFVAQ